MLYRKYGSTEINVSALGMGGMRFRNQENVDECASLVKAAYDGGINYFDTASGYGKSEELFGAAFRDMLKTRREKPFYIATKTFAESPEGVRKDIEISLSRLGLPSIDFYHVWCVLSWDKYLKRKTAGILKEFERLREEGLLRHICVSTHMKGEDIGRLLRDYPFDGVLLGYSVMNFAYREKALEEAATLSRGVVVMNPLGGGLIPQNPELFSFVKSRPDDTAVSGALRFLFNDKRISTALVGISSKEELNEALRAVNGFQALPENEVARIRSELKDRFEGLCTNCRYCDKCPQGIPVPQFMESFNILKLKDNPKEAVGRLRWHWGHRLEDRILDRCSNCGLCEEACTQKLPIRKRLEVLRAELEKTRVEEAEKKRNSQ
ncbi:MAG: hypothetical protein A2X49_04725 [Lentisphaerae bacterium GWF2_52_8]|nr:MAG: hypothetical protein A2X49_04725 [Lentisphaerae bacterium GWF2_52_8]